MFTSFFNRIGFLCLFMGISALLTARDIKSLPGGFIENKGQILNQDYQPNPDVLYLYSGPGIKIQLRKTGYSYELFGIQNIPDPDKRSVCRTDELSAVRVVSHRVDIDFEGMNTNPLVVAADKSNDFLNFYTCGHEATGVSTFNKVTYKNIYKNTDIEFTLGNNSSAPLKYNIILHPGADINALRFLIRGAEGLRIENNALAIKTSQGELQEKIPFSYYTNTPGQNEKVGFILRGQTLCFSAKQDPGRTLVIDPSSNLIWCTYYAGSSLDYCYGTKVDSQNNVYIAGHTLSTSNIATNNSFQSALAGSFDGYLAKFDPDGVRLWATYIGGTGLEQIYAMTIDKTDAIYVTGDTSSPTNVASQGVHQTIYGGGPDDVLLARFDSNGQRVWATYLGGTLHEFAQAVTVDIDGNVVIAGHTQSSNAMATTGAYSTSYNFGEDGFVARFSNSGQRLWCTYYGDSGNDIVYSVTTDSGKNVYVTGITTSIAGIAANTSHQPALAGGSDAFLSRFSASGSTLDWATYYGGNNNDDGTAVRMGNDGLLYLCGNTDSPNNISTPSAYQLTQASAEDGYLACFNTSGTRIWGTYRGGNATDYINDMVLDDNNNLVFCGQTLSTNSISTTGAYQSALDGVNYYDAWFAKWSKLGTPKLGTYFGKPFNENARSIAVDKTGKVYIAGETTSTVGLATAAAHQTLGVGSGDVFLAKFCMDIEPSITPANNSTLCVGPATISAVSGYSTYLWNNNAVVNPIIVNHALVGVYHYSVYVNDGFGCAGGSTMYTLSVMPCYVSLEEQETTQPFRLYPVPSSNQLTIDFTEHGHQPEHLKIYSITGQALTVLSLTDGSNTISVKDLVPGVYILEAVFEGKSFYSKFVRE